MHNVLEKSLYSTVIQCVSYSATGHVPSFSNLKYVKVPCEWQLYPSQICDDVAKAGKPEM